MFSLPKLFGWARGAAPAADAVLPTAPPSCFGSVDEVSALHVEGWIHDEARPGARVAFHVMLDGDDMVLARGNADLFRYGLAIGDGVHGFYVRLPRALTPAEQERVVVRVPHTGQVIARSPHLRTVFEPVAHVAMDIVDNCNLRCPFCVYDYAHTHATHLMSDETLDAVLRFLPYTRDGEFWFSCLHEPTLHPKLTQFIDRVPRAFRNKLFYTSNFAKRMPDSYFEWLGSSGMHHVNVSIESLDPAAYERMRKGARHRIFLENWNKLIPALNAGDAPPLLRYIVLPYKSTQQDVPDLVAHLLQERRAAQVEVRYTFDVPHMPRTFRDAEFLDRDEWLRLRDRLAPLGPAVQLFLPPEALVAPAPVDAVIEAAIAPTQPPAANPAAPAIDHAVALLPDRYTFRVSWDGTLTMNDVQANMQENPVTERPAGNVDDIIDVQRFLLELDDARMAT